MNTARPAFEALTPALVGSTITLRSSDAQVTGLLIGVIAERRPKRNYYGAPLQSGVTVAARFDLDGEVWNVHVAPGMTLEVHP